MLESPFTKKREVQYRGPSNSRDYNDRLEENYNDLALLKNLSRLTQEELQQAFSQLLKHHLGVARALSDLEARLDVVEEGTNTITFRNISQVDNDWMNGTAYEISEVDRNTVDERHGLLTLPHVEDSSLSKLAFVDVEGNAVIPSTLLTKVVGEDGTADNTGAYIDTNRPHSAIVRSAGVVWERNVVVSSPDAQGAIVTLYVKAPIDLFTTSKSNALVVHPYPLMSTDILEVAYTSKVDPVLSEDDGYTPINQHGHYEGDDRAVGWVAPGGFAGDLDLNAGLRLYRFDPVIITGFRIKLRQRNSYVEGGNYVYSYGLTNLDLRYDKFLDEGKTVIRFDAPSGQTISSVTNVIPEIFNVNPAEITDVFSYRILWETAPGSGVPTDTPVPFSSKVWVEVSLSKTAGKGTPALSGLTVEFE